MITVFKGNEKIICTEKTYEEQFKHLGYQIASDKKEATEKVASFENEEIKEEVKEEVKNQDDDYEEISEKYKVEKKSGRKRK